MHDKKILIVDDDREITELIDMFLQKDGFQTVITNNGKGVISFVHKEKPDLIILDILLPEMDGIEICRELRKITQVPIVFISCKSEELDKIIGLTVGADDYITKPFSPAELSARVRAHLRRQFFDRSDIDEKQLLEFPGMEINLLTHTVKVQGQPVLLQAKEFELLSHMAKNPERVFKVEELFEMAWGEPSYGDTRTVMVHISRLRKKIEDEPANPRYITTIRGAGYKFNRQPSVKTTV